ncbi:uncharacterized protein [Mytilus edulis]|uniref:uncharacterized protein n=1 Tax=Mytilus edulis TaxID=6550 RepID=UPI0039EEAB39
MRGIIVVTVMLAMLGVTEGSSKKGIGIAGADTYICGDEQAFTTAHWWYDWRIKPTEHQLKNCTNKPKPGYVPLVWGHGQWADTKFNLTDDIHYVLGFNEPNHPEQVNMTPHTAAKHWQAIETRAPGKVLVSPAAAPCGHCQYDTIAWLDEFFRNCTGCRVDHIATHAYWCNADKIMSFLKQIWDRFHKPIWLTEFACMKTHSVNVQLQFMRDLLPRLEAAPFVFRYAWFVSRWSGDGFVTSSASLLHQNSPTLTTLGHFYNNFIH